MRALLILALFLGAMELVLSCSPPEYIFGGVPSSSCNDGKENGRETDTDCGGLDCEVCATGLRCDSGFDCVLGSCVDGLCQAKHCTDETQGDGETDIDCGGGECQKCVVKQGCSTASDCKSNSCACQGEGCPPPGQPLPPNVRATCVATGCDDAAIGGKETDTDCGGGTCPGCAVGKSCRDGVDCVTGICIGDRCSFAQCGDGMKQENEQGIDCGGLCPTLCEEMRACGDGEPSPGETDTDCGGGTCPRCKLGDSCEAPRDCLSNTCIGAVCSIDPCVENPAQCAPPPGTGGAGGGPDAGEGGEATSEAGRPSMGGTSGGPSGGAPQGGTMGGAPVGGGGSGGTLGGSPSGGTAGIGGSAGAGGSPLSGCPGCARLSVPLADPNHKANFVIKLPNLMGFTTARITFRVYKQAGSGGLIKGYVQHGPDNGDGQAFRQLFQNEPKPLSEVIGWTEFSWDVGAQPTDFNKTNVARVGIQIIGSEATSWTNPTVVYVDSIRVSGTGTSGWTFDERSSVFGSPTTDSNANVLWLNAGDNPVGGASVTWVGQ